MILRRFYLVYNTHTKVLNELLACSASKKSSPLAAFINLHCYAYLALVSRRTNFSLIRADLPERLRK